MASAIRSAGPAAPDTVTRLAPRSTAMLAVGSMAWMARVTDLAQPPHPIFETLKRYILCSLDRCPNQMGLPIVGRSRAAGSGRSARLGRHGPPARSRDCEGLDVP